MLLQKHAESLSVARNSRAGRAAVEPAHLEPVNDLAAPRRGLVQRRFHHLIGAAAATLCDGGTPAATRAPS